eukprot:CCRYP_008696-RA/>CCRYP_008696-RA protein AED:0.37 eAED:0.37 QI:0/0/0/1/0/0/5/0/407
MRTLEAIQDQLSPGNKLQIEQQLQRRLPRVNNTKQAVPLAQPEPSLPRPKPILKPPTHAVQEDSIAARLKARRAQQPSGTNITKADDESIAERLLRRITSTEPDSGSFPRQLLEYRQLLRHPKFKEAWNISAANEFGRLAQGIKGRVKATDTIKFIPKSDIPPDRLKDVTYINPNRKRRTKPYSAQHLGQPHTLPDDVGTPTADLLLIKIFLNSVISTPGARFATADLSNFYLCTPMPRPEFGRVKLSDIPEEIIEEYKLHEWVYFRADKTHYGLPQAGSLSHDLLEKRLNAEGYVKTLTVPGLWKHKTRNIQFVLVVDDFGIKYVKKEDLDHLVGVLKRYYDVSVDIHGKEFVKIELDWDYKRERCTYQWNLTFARRLRQFDNLVPKKRQDSLTHILNQNTEQRSN